MIIQKREPLNYRISHVCSKLYDNCSYKDLETNCLRLPPVDLSAFASGLPSRCDLLAYSFLVCIWFENL